MVSDNCSIDDPLLMLIKDMIPVYIVAFSCFKFVRIIGIISMPAILLITIQLLSNIIIFSGQHAFYVNQNF